ncbi:hypothetical protein [Sutcliffiella horikoshii]
MGRVWQLITIISSLALFHPWFLPIINTFTILQLQAGDWEAA